MPIAFALGVFGVAACHSRTEFIPFDHCDRNPADSAPPPPISVRASAESPGVVVIKGHAEHGEGGSVAILDERAANPRDGAGRFIGVAPGPHRVRVRSFGYGARDTIIVTPTDSSLYIDVPLTRGGGFSRCEDGVYERRIPWWKFWDWGSHSA